MPAGRRIAIAALVGLPYLAASFLAQSAFKETAMALFVLAFALALAARERGGGRRRPPAAWRPVIAACSAAGARQRVHVQRPRARLVRARAARCGSRSRRSPGAARSTGGPCAAALARPPGCARGRALLVLIASPRSPSRPAREFASKIADVQDVRGAAELAGVRGRGARDLARGRLPGRPRRGLRARCSRSPIGGARDRSTASSCSSAPRELALLAMLVTGGDRLRRHPRRSRRSTSRRRRWR